MPPDTFTHLLTQPLALGLHVNQLVGQLSRELGIRWGLPPHPFQKGPKRRWRALLKAAIDFG